MYPLYEVHLNLVINDDVFTCDTGLFNTYFILSNREKYLGNGNSDLNIFLNVNYIGDKEIKFNLNSLFMYYYNNGIKPYCNIKIYYVGNIEYGYNRKEFLAICDNLEIVKVC